MFSVVLYKWLFAKSEQQGFYSSLAEFSGVDVPVLGQRSLDFIPCL